jgi:hypothetical protein
LAVDPKDLFPVEIWGILYDRGTLVPIRDPWVGGYELAGDSPEIGLVHGAEERYRSLERGLGRGPTQSELRV